MKQVNIVQVKTWHANEETEINVLQVNHSIDNLIDSCVVSYSLISTSGKVIATKGFEISGSQYMNWDGNIDDVIQMILDKHGYQKQ